jgi:hypothetical protein
MNCANHPDIEKVAFCRTCGKPLCATCVREVRGVVYCENCLAARLEGVQPPPAAVPAAGFVPTAAVPAGSGGGPNPALAGILAGFFPVGVGAVYTGQYAKGLAHLLIVTGLIWGLSSGNMGGLEPVLGIALGAFYFYQIIDAVRTARAIQAGQPVPDPFGLARTFSTGDKSDLSRVPTGALVLIGLGALFLLHNMGVWFFSMDRFWPIILIAIGVWLFARRWGLIGHVSYDCERCRARCVMGPAVLVTLGLLFLLDTQGAKSFGHTWPLLLVVIGLVKVWQGSASTEGHVDQRPMGGAGPSGPVIGEVQPPSSEVKNG